MKKQLIFFGIVCIISSCSMSKFVTRAAFKDLDTNNDKYISWEEFNSDSQKSGMSEVEKRQKFNEFDEDKDNKISVIEMQRKLKK